MSPPLDAPSPTANDDPFIHGIGDENGDEGEDMEMDDEDAPSSSMALIPPRDYIAPIPPVPSALDPRLQVCLCY